VTLPPEEAKARMQRMRRVVRRSDVHEWARAFLAALRAA
jgi:trehalose-6-phosphate synthase